MSLQIKIYREHLDMYLSDINVFEDLLQCAELHCDTHVSAICQLHDNILESYIKATIRAISRSKPLCKNKRRTIIPGWTYKHAIARDLSLLWHSIWIDNDKPETGWVSEIISYTRSKYHYLVRSLKRSRDQQIRCALGSSLFSHNNRDYWKEISKIRYKCRSSSYFINGYNDSTDIVNEFASKYNVLYNSVTSDPTDMQSMALSIRKDIITTIVRALTIVFPMSPLCQI